MRGFSLPELLVSALLVGILTATLALAVRSVGPALDAIVTRSELDQRCRLAVERAVPVLQSAVPRFQEALYAPADGEEGAVVIFSTNQDLLGNPPASYDPRANPPGPFRTLKLENREETLVLSDASGGGPEQVLARGVRVRFHRAGHLLTLRVSAQARSRTWSLETVTGLPAYAR